MSIGYDDNNRYHSPERMSQASGLRVRFWRPEVDFNKVFSCKFIICHNPRRNVGSVQSLLRQGSHLGVVCGCRFAARYNSGMCL